MLTYKDSLRQRLYSDSFEEGLRFGIKYFAKVKAQNVASLFADSGALYGKNIGKTGLSYGKARALGYSDEQIANMIKEDKGVYSFINPKKYRTQEVVEGYGTKGGDVTIDGKTYLSAAGNKSNYDDYVAAAQKANKTAMSKSEFNRIMKAQHAAENEYYNQFFNGSGSKSGNGGSGSEKGEGGVWNWIKENPGKTAAIGGGTVLAGLGARALLKGRDDRDDRYYR